MKLTMNITTCSEDTDRYANRSDLQQFFRSYGLDGLEVLEAGPDKVGLIHADDTIGVHLRYYAGWMDFWMEDQQRLLAEYQQPENWIQTYGGETKDALVQAYRSNIRFANTLQPEYLVFHVSECTMAESMYRKYHYSDEQVCDAAVELLNQVTSEITGEPWLLLENLWYPGLTLERPEIVQRLLSGLNYKKVGVMMDTGHLMHTNTELKTPDDAVDYIHDILNRYEDLSFIKGIHLHQSLSGALAKHLMENWTQTEGTYFQQLWAVMSHIFEIDTHRPFCSYRIQEIFDRLPALDYVCMEQISGSREEHAGYLATQVSYLKTKQ